MLFDISAISANNGWVIAALGVSIVFSALLLLLTLISQLHKIVHIIDHKQDYLEKIKKKFTTDPPDPAKAPEASSRALPMSLRESARQYRLLGERMADPFPLPELIRTAEKAGLYHPHSTVCSLLKTKVITPDADGYYTWGPNGKA